MNSLRDLFSELLSRDFIDSRPIKLTVQKINTILNPAKFVSSEVKAASTQLKESAQEKIHVDNGLAAIFCGISQGKTLIVKALDVAEHQSADDQIVDQFNKVLEALDGLCEETERCKVDTSKIFDELNAAVDVFKSTSRKTCSDALRTFVANVKAKFAEKIRFACKVYATETALSWFSASLTLHSAQPGTCSPLPVTFVEKLEKLTQPASSNMTDEDSALLVRAVLELQKQMVNINALFSKSAGGSMNIVDIFNCSKGFTTYVNEYCSTMSSIDSKFVKTFDSFGEILASMSGSKLQHELHEQKQVLGKLLAKAIKTKLKLV